MTYSPASELSRLCCWSGNMFLEREWKWNVSPAKSTFIYIYDFFAYLKMLHTDLLCSLGVTQWWNDYVLFMTWIWIPILDREQCSNWNVTQKQMKQFLGNSAYSILKKGFKKVLILELLPDLSTDQSLSREDTIMTCWWTQSVLSEATVLHWVGSVWPKVGHISGQVIGKT